MTFEAWVIREGDGYATSHGVPILFRSQLIAAHAEKTLRPAGSDTRRIARVVVTLDEQADVVSAVLHSPSRENGDKR